MNPFHELQADMFKTSMEHLDVAQKNLDEALKTLKAIEGAFKV
ncbi:MAG: hypothetical protein Q6360_13200 [Candidatus Brocadiales bacterium]|nr:hypothetical protein [Candidatus Brocadiales bacterium]